MTISLKADASGTFGTIQVGGVDVVGIPATGLSFFKNKLFNGEVTRINQRSFDGNWTPKPIMTGGSIAQNESSYGYDMWCKLSATGMGQYIEAGNFRPGIIHTISCSNGQFATYQMVSPASGNWLIGEQSSGQPIIPFAARNIQVEEGLVATPFELRPITFELSQCQRYFEQGNFWLSSQGSSNYPGMGVTFVIQKRTIPVLYLFSASGTPNKLTVDGVEAPAVINTILPFETMSCRIYINNSLVTVSQFINGYWKASAVM